MAWRAIGAAALRADLRPVVRGRSATGALVAPPRCVDAVSCSCRPVSTKSRHAAEVEQLLYPRRRGGDRATRSATDRLAYLLLVRDFAWRTHVRSTRLALWGGASLAMVCVAAAVVATGERGGGTPGSNSEWKQDPNNPDMEYRGVKK